MPADRLGRVYTNGRHAGHALTWMTIGTTTTIASTSKAEGMHEPGQWYVSYTVKPDDGSRRYARKTRIFDTEELAKLFVREIANENLRPTAGTINPHSPKKIISAANMTRWLETPMQLADPHAAAEPMRSQQRSP
jgi:hypothetical protein